MRKSIFIFLILSLIVCSSDLFADTLHLKDGTLLEGMVIEETPEYIIFDVYGGRVKFFRSEISRIEKGPLKVAPPKPAPTKGKGAPPKGAAPAKKGGGIQFSGLKMPEITATGWQGEFLRRVMKYVERQSNPKALIQNFSIPTLLFWLIEALFVFLLMALFIKLYIRLFGVSVPYGRAAFFLFKFNIVSNIIATIFSVAMAPPAGPTPEGAQAAQWSQLIALPAAFLLILGVFFWLANRDLESGFLKTIGLLVVMVFAYLLGGVTFSLFGLY